MNRRTSLGRARLTALLACSLVATVVPLSATAEYGIPAGSGATITAGQPLLVRMAPGWDAAVAYEIADGSYVTVWGAEQAAPDGSWWYPIDGGFVPAEGVTSVATLDGGVALDQEPTTDPWGDPAAAQGWVDPATGQWVDPAAAPGWVDPATGQWVAPTPSGPGWTDPVTGEWVAPNATGGWVDPTTGAWVAPNAGADPAATGEGWLEPATGEWVEPGTATAGVDPNAAPGWLDPATGQWVVALEQDAAPSAGWTDPATGAWVEPATTGEEVAPTAAMDPASTGDGWVDPATGAWVAPTGKTDDWGGDRGTAVSDEWTAPAPVGAPEPWGEPIATAYIAGTNGDGAVCRVAPERGTAKLAVLGEGEAVEVRGEAVGDWQPVNCAGVGGYVNTALIAWEPVVAPAAAPEREGKVNRGKRGNNGNAGNDGTASATGNRMADFAMQYVGYPYVYAGEGPYAFDCSGFTKFVAANTLGMDITHDMFAQIEMGQQVGRNELRPGDLVFFANTFRPGLSHNGIYIGDGQFVHAENESTGVRVSDLNSDYYGSRWAGATRLS